MTSPTVSASLDKPSYAPGETMTLTASYGDADNTAGTVTIVVTDASGASSSPITVPYSISDALTLAVTDNSGRAWTKVTDNGSVAVYRATA